MRSGIRVASEMAVLARMTCASSTTASMTRCRSALSRADDADEQVARAGDRVGLEHLGDARTGARRRGSGPATLADLEGAERRDRVAERGGVDAAGAHRAEHPARLRGGPAGPAPCRAPPRARARRRARRCCGLVGEQRDRAVRRGVQARSRRVMVTLSSSHPAYGQHSAHAVQPPRHTVAHRALGHARSMTHDTTPTSHLDLTDQEREADLDLEQLKQLVGLVEYDENKDPFPVTGWDAIVFVVGNATQSRALLPERVGHGARRLPRPRERQPRPQVVRAQVRLDPVRHQGRGRPGQPAHRPPRQARRRRRRHLPRGARRRPVRRPGRAAGATRARGADDHHRRARHGAHRRHRDLRRDPPHPRAARRRRADVRRARTCPATSPRSSTYGQARGRAQAALPGPRPHRRQRRARQDGRVGHLLQQGHGLREHGRVHR